MDVITGKKVKLIEWLCGEEIILQYVSSRKLITMKEYTTVKSISDPVRKVTELLDLICKKGNETCIAFLDLLKEDDVNESRPELKEWIRTINTPALRDPTNSNTSQPDNGEISDHKEFLKNNRGNLIDGVKNVDRIVDDLNFTNEMAANVRAENTDQAKMRKVLEYTNSKKAAKLLVDVLYKHAKDVMEELTMG